MSRNDQYQYIISVAALVMSALAMVFAFMELRSSDKQFEANVWPYVDLDITLNSDSFEVSASNKGMGPALVHEFRILHAGEVIEVPSDLLDRTDYAGEADLSLSSAGIASSVLSAGERVSALRIEGADTGRAISTIMQDVDIEICYCAVNGICWNNLGASQFRTEIDSCEAQSEDLERRLELFAEPGEGEE